MPREAELHRPTRHLDCTSPTAMEEWQHILVPGRTCWALDPVTEAGILIDAREYYRAFYLAACEAQRYIFVAGWQFDSEVALLRGRDLALARGPVRFLEFLNWLCRRNDRLKIRILGWDYSILYAFEREWFQKFVFHWNTHERVDFCVDSYHPLGASHHQKFAVIDGEIGFIGGTDICAHRWDDRGHQPFDPERFDTDGQPYGPYHEVQAYVRGSIVRRMTDAFCERWRDAGGGELRLPERTQPLEVEIEASVRLPPSRAALSRTRGANLVPLREAIHETREQFVAAIRAAEDIIYIETQYLSSHAIQAALIERMHDSTHPCPEIVVVLPSKAWAVLETLAVGLAQVHLLRVLKAHADRTGAPLGIYCSAVPEIPMEHTFIHSKVLIIDDRLLCVASANATNRSMGLDTELNLSWEAGAEDAAVARAIRRTRVSLLAEHCGVRGIAEVKRLARHRGLVAELDRIVADPRFRLRSHADLWKSPVLDGIGFDPARPLIEEDLYEHIAIFDGGILARGLGWLNRVRQRGTET